jgi:hypothetical protein
MTALNVVPPLDEHRRTAAVELLRARDAAYCGGMGEVFDLLTLEIFLARLHLAASTDAVEQDKYLAEANDLSQRRWNLVAVRTHSTVHPAPRDGAPTAPDVTSHAPRH